MSRDFLLNCPQTWCDFSAVIFVIEIISFIFTFLTSNVVASEWSTHTSMRCSVDRLKAVLFVHTRIPFGPEQAYSFLNDVPPPSQAHTYLHYDAINTFQQYIENPLLESGGHKNGKNHSHKPKKNLLRLVCVVVSVLWPPVLGSGFPMGVHRLFCIFISLCSNTYGVHPPISYTASCIPRPPFRVFGARVPRISGN